MISSRVLPEKRFWFPRSTPKFAVSESESHRGVKSTLKLRCIAHSNSDASVWYPGTLLCNLAKWIQPNSDSTMRKFCGQSDKNRKMFRKRSLHSLEESRCRIISDSSEACSFHPDFFCDCLDWKAEIVGICVKSKRRKHGKMYSSPVLFSFKTMEAYSSHHKVFFSS